MHNHKKSQWFKNFFKSQLLLFAGLIIVLGFLIWPLANNLNKRSQLDKEIEQLKAEVTRGESQNNEFKKIIEYLDSNQFVEEQARLNLNLKKEGEKVASIKDLGSTQTVELNNESQQQVNEPKPAFSVRARVNRLSLIHISEPTRPY